MSEEREINHKGKRIFVSVVLAALIVAVFIGLLSGIIVKDYEKTVTTDTQQRLSTIAGLEAENIRSRILDYLHELKMLAQNPRIRKAILNNESAQDIMAKEGYSPELAVYTDHLEHRINGLYRLDSKGIVQSRIPFKKDRVGADFSAKPGVSKVLETRRLHISEIFPAFSGDNCFSICRPVFEGEQFIGIIRQMTYIETMNRELAKIEVGKRGYAQVLDNDGTIIAHPDGEHLSENVIAARKEAYPDHDWSQMEDIVARMTRGEEGAGYYHSVWRDAEEPEFVKKLIAFAPVRLPGKLWSVGVTMGYDEICGPIRAFTRRVSIAAGALILVFVTGSVWLYNLQKDKIRLTAQAQSANELMKVNRRLEEEILERRRIQENLTKAKKEAEEANETKGQFLANMSHEIRTPMNAIMGFSEILAEEQPTDAQREYIDIIRNSSKHLLLVIDDILDFSKIEAGKMDIEQRQCPLEYILLAIEPILHSLAKDKGLMSEVRTAENLPVNINTDPDRLQQCLVNLISNAVKFTEEGHVYLRVSLEDRDNRPLIRFDVEDTGIGIPFNKQGKVFESFSQADASLTRKYGGTGLGLAITRRLAEMMGGEVTLYSVEGIGSTFSLIVPVGLNVAEQSAMKYAQHRQQQG